MDLAAVRMRLQGCGDGVFRDTGWLTESQQRPEQFARALLRHHAELSPAPPKSAADAGYDFYHDLVTRHAGGSRAALCFWEPESGMQSLSYAELHGLCTRRGAAWAAQGARAGEPLCVIAHLGKELLVALLTGLRLGMKVSLLPPLGPDALLLRLRALKRPRVAAAARYLRLLAGSELLERALSDEAPGERTVPDASSHTYAADAPALVLFSPRRDPPAEPLEVTAATTYLGALRDGLLLLPLLPGTVLAAPQQDLLQSQPALLLTTLLQGATYLHADAAATVPRGAPSPLDAAHVLLVSAACRDTLLDAPPRPLPRVQLWIVDPQQEPAETRWRDLAAHCGLQGTAAATLLLDAAAGGSLLFSLRRAGAPPLLLWPAPGLPFALLRPDGSGQPAQTGCGVWQPLPHSSGLVLAHHDGAFLYAGTPQPTLHGRCYPAREVETAAAALPFVAAAIVVGERGDASAPTLLVFTGPEPLAAARERAVPREAALQERIRVRLGAEFVPPQIEQYAMLPRRRGGSLDRAWCAEQYQRGALREREQDPLFHLLDRLRVACTPAEARRDGSGGSG